RQEYRRVILRQHEDGGVVMANAGSQSSGVLSAVSRADGLAIVPPHGAVRVGDKLRFIPLSEIVGHI
ncbi:MAG: molybdopterin molybdenumtransferase MoeA, partial [Pseudohongiellaceae bacterium]|nr:molybdopterin molybdenumtransferase MoeA [Pseudohongiellaceae bacterium]